MPPYECGGEHRVILAGIAVVPRESGALHVLLCVKRRNLYRKCDQPSRSRRILLRFGRSPKLLRGNQARSRFAPLSYGRRGWGRKFASAE